MVTITTLPFVMPFRVTFSGAFSMAVGTSDRASHHTALLAFVCQPLAHTGSAGPVPTLPDFGPGGGNGAGLRGDIRTARARRAARRPIFWWPHFSHAPHAWSCSSRGPRSCPSRLTPELEALWVRIGPTIRTARARHPTRPLRASSFRALGPKPEAAPGYHGANQERLVRGGATRSCPDHPHRLSCRSGPYSLRRFPRPS